MRVTCQWCLKGLEAKSSKSKYHGECWELKRKSGTLKNKPRPQRARDPERNIFVHCDGGGCCNFLVKTKAEARKSRQNYCTRECYRQSYRPWEGQEGGRKRVRPGGEGLPSHAQPETIAANELWPVKSWFDDKGYTLLYMPDCPYAPPSTGRIYEHRLIMSMELGRKLERTEHVDHDTPISEGGTNERSNLQILTPSNHMKKTASQNWLSWRTLSKAVRELGFTPQEALDILAREADKLMFENA